MKVPYEDLLDAAVVIRQWHGGQFTPSYAVQSSVYAGRDVPIDIVEDAIHELSKISRQSRKTASKADLVELDEAIAQLEYAAASVRRHPEHSKENPVNTGNLAMGAVGAGIGIGLLWALWRASQTPKP